jgi:hypothetical protein
MPYTILVIITNGAPSQSAYPRRANIEYTITVIKPEKIRTALTAMPIQRDTVLMINALTKASMLKPLPRGSVIRLYGAKNERHKSLIEKKDTKNQKKFL